MNSKQKILSVMHHIKSDSEINANPQWAKFVFNTRVIGPGILSADQELRILNKLYSESCIKIFKRDENGAMEEITRYAEFDLDKPIAIQLQPYFWTRYHLLSITSLTENTWNLINPFWLLWQAVKIIFDIFLLLWRKSRIPFIIGAAISLISFAISLFGVDWNVVIKNINSAANWLLKK